jgi:hypothetical protein
MNDKHVLRGLGEVAVASPLFLFAPVYRPWHLRWGARDAEVAGAMPGDELVPEPSFNATRAITIDAPPDAVWPWLVQIGYGRAGWYSYDLFDNGARPSAERILPEYQEPKVGDWVPMWSEVNETTAFKITAFEPNRWLLWEKPRSSWAWKLVPLEGGRTRLISRLKQRYDWRASPGSALLTLILFEFGDFPMMRKLFLNVKQRAQRLAIASAAGAPAIGAGIPMNSQTRRVAVVENAIDIARSPRDVFDYCTDLTREPEWNPKAKRVEKVTDGPIGLGTRFEAEFLQGNPMMIELMRFDRPVAWESVGRSRRLDARGEGRVSATEEGARLVMRMELKPKGTLRLLLPVLARLMHKQEERNLAAIKEALEASGASAAPSGA